jgi:glyoxylase-like metal-dependent hydrolase (beta-lactamase superfamily II)
MASAFMNPLDHHWWWRTLIEAAAGVCLLGATLLAAPQSLAEADVRIRSLVRGIHVVEAVGRNVGVAAGADGALVIDANFRELGEKTRAAVRSVTDRPIRFLVNTHGHRDHVGGNYALITAGTLNIVHETVALRRSASDSVATMGVSEAVTLSAAGGVDVFHVPAAHTDGDLVVRFRNANVIFVGDLFFNPLYPAIVGGSTAGLMAALTRIADLIDDETIVVPGHGPLSNKTELVAYRDMLRDVRDRIARAVEEGRTRSEIVASKPTATHDPRWGHGIVRFENSSLVHNGDWFAGVVYDDLTRRR